MRRVVVIALLLCATLAVYYFAKGDKHMGKPVPLLSGESPAGKSEVKSETDAEQSQSTDSRVPMVNPAGNEAKTRIDVQMVMVRVGNSNGRPIPQARICLEEGESEWKVLGETNARGELACAAIGRKGVRLVAQSSGCARKQQYFPDGVTHDVNIVMEANALILGRIVRRDGQPAAEGTHVLAFPRGVNLNGKDPVRTALKGQGCVASAQCDYSGAFSIEGLAANQRYTLFAGGHGFVTVRGECDVSPDGQQHVLVVDPCYGCAIRYVDAEGQPIEATQDCMIRASANPADNCAPTVQPCPFQLIELAGVSPELLDQRGPSFSVDAWSAEADGSTAGPIDIVRAIPGYALLETQVMAYRIKDGIRETTISMPRTTTGLGLMHIEFSGLLADLPATSPGFPTCTMQVTNTALGRGFELARPLVPIDGHWDILGVPDGKYRVVLSLSGGCAELPRDSQSECDVSVGQDPAAMRFDLSVFGGINLVLIGSDGSALDGGYTLRLHRTNPPGGPAFALPFSRAPYAVGYLEPGEYDIDMYELVLSSTAERSVTKKVHTAVGVRSGTVTETRITVE